MTQKHRSRFLCRGIAVAMVMFLVALFAPSGAAAQNRIDVDTSTIRLLKAQYGALAGQHRLLLKQQRELLRKQGDLADEIEKVQDSDPGILGRMRLERLLAENLDLSNRLNEVAKSMAANEEARVSKREALFRVYTTEMERVARKLRHAKGRKDAKNLADRFYELRQSRRKWRTARTVESDFSRLIVEENDTDGPDELLAKAEILSDIVRKIRDAIREINRDIMRLQREKKLGEDFDTMVKEMNLFEEGARFMRRADEGRDDGDEAVQPEVDDSGLHVPPIDSSEQAPPGSVRAGRSIEAEIKRLKAEKKLLEKLAGDLAGKAKQLRLKAVALRDDKRR
ncbi:MAG: hypothetical protein P9L99_16015 [Candidatus Lernaella stagnicola]|nr:hypothetical protein [Candidatus Lernaella stagnicola]